MTKARKGDGVPGLDGDEQLVAQTRVDVIRYLRRVMNNPKAAFERRDRAASRLAAIIGDAAPVPGGGPGSAAKAKGLKQQRMDDAQSLIEEGSPFTPSAPPRLN
jgi:hypothetical protein